MADDAVGDEILGSGRDVVEAHRFAERFDADHAEPGFALDGLAGDVALACDRWIDAVEEA